MFKKNKHFKRMSLPFLITLAIATGLGVANKAAAEPIAATVHMGISGNWYPKPGKNHINWYYLHANMMLAEKMEEDPGGIAVFGLFDSGEIQLVAHAQYLPVIQSGRLSRKLTPSARIELQAMPRYVLICSWVTEDDQPTGTRYLGYGERDDANAIDEYNAHVRYHPLSAAWVNIPAKRVENKFSDRDYCDEIARNKTSSVPLWLPNKKQK